MFNVYEQYLSYKITYHLIHSILLNIQYNISFFCERNTQIHLRASLLLDSKELWEFRNVIQQIFTLSLMLRHIFWYWIWPWTCFGQWNGSKWDSRTFPWNVFVPRDSLSFHSAVARNECAVGTPRFHTALAVRGPILETTCILESSRSLGQQIHRKWVGISNFFEKPLYFEMAYNTALLWTKWVWLPPDFMCWSSNP